MIDINELRQSLGAVQPEEVAVLLNRLEEAESDALEQARMNGMGASREAALMAKLEAAEKERDALQAKVEAMEKQEPVASVWRCDNGHIHGSCERTLLMGAKFYVFLGVKGEIK